LSSPSEKEKKKVGKNFRKGKPSSGTNSEGPDRYPGGPNGKGNKKNRLREKKKTEKGNSAMGCEPPQRAVG